MQLLIKNCQMCGEGFGESNEGYNEISFSKTLSYVTCNWCADRVKEFIKNNIDKTVINVNWGGGRVTFNDWKYLRRFIRENHIEEVLEFGTGLSTELFINEGLQVTTCDILKNHSNLYSENKSFDRAITAIHYDYGNTPEFDRQWEFVFVDGSVERSCEVRAAMKYSKKWILLHDPNLGEESFFPNDEWEQVDLKLFRKK